MRLLIYLLITYYSLSVHILVYGLHSTLDGPRPTPEQVMELRGHMLKYVKQLILKGQGIHEDELQSILNYLTTVHEVTNWQLFCYYPTENIRYAKL